MFNERQNKTQKMYEAKGYTLLKNFAPTLQLSHLNQHVDGDRIDYDAITSKGNKVNIEVKTRTCTSTQYPTTFIKKDKVEALVNADGYALYINFFSDGVVGVWIITKDDLLLPSEWRRVWNEGNGCNLRIRYFCSS